MMRRCVVCHKEFPSSNRNKSGLCRKCHIDLWWERHPDYFRHWRKKHPGYSQFFKARKARREHPEHFGLHFCQECGEVFYKTKFNRKFCSNICYNASRNRRIRMKRRANRPESFTQSFICAKCHKKVNRLHHRQKYCLACSRHYIYLAPKKTIICSSCGAEVVRNGRHQKYCFACSPWNKQWKNAVIF